MAEIESDDDIPMLIDIEETRKKKIPVTCNFKIYLFFCKRFIHRAVLTGFLGSGNLFMIGAYLYFYLAS